MDDDVDDDDGGAPLADQRCVLDREESDTRAGRQAGGDPGGRPVVTV